MNKQLVFEHDHDITKERSELSNFLTEYLKQEGNKEKYFDAVFDNYKPADEDKSLLSVAIQFFVSIFMGIFHSGLVPMTLAKMKKNPHLIEFSKIYIFELAFMLSKSHLVRNIDEKTREKKAKKFLKYFNILKDISDKLEKLGKPYGFLFSSDIKDYDESVCYLPQPGDYAYEELFAFELRQKSIQDIPAFLNFQSQNHPKNYVSFLESLLIEYADFFEKKTKKAAKRWIKEEKQKSKIKKQEIKPIGAKSKTQDKSELDNVNAFLNTLSFQPLPNGYKSINGGMKPNELIKFLSFLIIEKNKDGNAFMTKDEFLKFIKYGPLVVPTETSDDLINLELEATNSKGIFYYAMAVLYKFHQVNKNTKIEYAKMLKHTFKDFSDLDLKNLNNQIRLKPKPSMKFSLNAYLPERFKTSRKFTTTFPKTKRAIS